MAQFFTAALIFASLWAQGNQDTDIKRMQKELQDLKGQIDPLRRDWPQLTDFSGGLMPDVYGPGTILIFSGSFQGRTRAVKGKDGTITPGAPDGALATTLLMGNPSKLSSELTLVFNDVSQLGHRCSINARLGRLFGDTYVSFGVDQLFSWGGTDTLAAWSVRAGKTFSTRSDSTKPFSRVFLQVGIGNGRYGPEGAINRLDSAGNSDPDMRQIGAFGSAGCLLSRNAVVFVRYAGNDWIAGTTLRSRSHDPTRLDYLYLSLAWADLTRQAGDGRRFTMSAGLVMPLGK